MAANQTIIQAAGQRDAPQKFDYSGYIKGLASIASFLVEKRKTTVSRLQNIDKITETAIGSVEESNLGPDAEAAIKVQRDLAYEAQKNMGGFHWTEKNKAAKYSYNKAIKNIEQIGKEAFSTSWNNLQGEMKRSIGNKTVSDYGGAEYKNWAYSVVNNETGIKFVKIENGVSTFLNHENEYVPLKELNTNIVTQKSSEVLYKKINWSVNNYKKKLSTMDTKNVGYDFLVDNDPANAAVVKTEVSTLNVEANDIMQQGLLDVETEIKNDNAFKSAAFDRIHILADGTRARFVDYYLSEGGMMDEELQNDLTQIYKN